MSRDRQIAVVASILGLAGLIVGIVAISQVSGAEDDWIRNRALPGAASSEGAVLQTQVAVREVADLAERVAELEKTPVPADEHGVTVELTDELLTPPPTTDPESLEPIADSLDPSAREGETGDLVSLEEEGDESDSDTPPIPKESLGKPAYIFHRELVLPIKHTELIWVGTQNSSECPWYLPDSYCGDQSVTFPLPPPPGPTTTTIECTGLAPHCPNFFQSSTKYWDKYISYILDCNEVINWGYPTTPVAPRVRINKVGYGDLPYDYWLAPSAIGPYKNGWNFEFNVLDAPGKPWIGGSKRLLSWRWDNPNGEIVTNEITIIIRDNETEELHYVDLRASLSFQVLTNDEEDWKSGDAASRCSADLTIVRSYP